MPIKTSSPILDLTLDRLFDIFSAVNPRDIGELRLTCRSFNKIIEANWKRLPRPFVDVSFINGKDKTVPDHYSIYDMLRPTKIVVEKQVRRNSAAFERVFVARTTSAHQCLIEDIPLINHMDEPTGEVFPCVLERVVFSLRLFNVHKGYMDDSEVKALNNYLPPGVLLSLSAADLQDVKLSTIYEIIKIRPLDLLKCKLNQNTWTIEKAKKLPKYYRAPNTNVITVFLGNVLYSWEERAAFIDVLLRFSARMDFMEKDGSSSSMAPFFDQLTERICTRRIADEIKGSRWTWCEYAVRMRK